MKAKNTPKQKFFTPVVDATPCDLVFATREMALEYALTMYASEEFVYLRGIKACKTFKAAVKGGVVYVVEYTLEA